jgi:plastocyanin
MDKHIHTVILIPGTDEAAFLENEAAGMEVVSNLNLFDSIISMRLTESEVATLLESDKVVDVEKEMPVIETVYPVTPEYSRNTTLETRNSPSGSNGADYSGTNFWFHGGVKITSNSAPIGFFTTAGEDAEVSATIEQNYVGEYVDIVAIEAGTPLNTYDSYAYSHPDFQDANNSPRFVKTDWTAYDSGLVDNDQASANTEFFSAHAIGVLSAAGGKYCGWSNASSLRVLYLSNGVAAAYNGVLNFHNNKPVNPDTGVRNATVVTGAWGFSGVDLTGAVPVDNIYRLDVYDTDGNLTTINRPTGTGSPQTYAITATASDSSNYTLSGTDRDGSVSGTDPALNLVVGDTLNITNNVSGSHPMYIKTTNTGGSGDQVSTPAATGQGTANVSWTPNAPGTYYYQCGFHSAMVGTITVIAQSTDGWGTDFTPFTDNLMVPRVIQDPADSTDKWMIPWNIGSRYTTLDTIMSNYNNAGGIYHFQSAGNNSTVGVSEEDPRKNNTIYIDPAVNYVDINLNGQGRYTFASTTSPSAPTVTSTKPCRMYQGGGSNQFTVAACQQSTVNPLLDDYSSRGPMIDISATGAYTWTAYPTTTYNDGTWGYFSGTSCAGPVAAGTASIMVCDFFIKRGVYPSIAQLKQIVSDNAKPTLVSEGLVDFENVSAAGNKPSTRLYSSSNVFRISENDFQNGGSDLSDLFGTPTDIINIPWGIRLGTGKYINAVRGPSYGKRSVSGQTYPRRKIRVEA